MKLQKLSMKLNPLGEIMNLSEAFNKLKDTKHDSSLENLGEWLDQNTSKPNKMKSLYKIAASLIFATMILIACTVPVQHEEEIGYMIKGVAYETEGNFKLNGKLRLEQVGLDPSQISVYPLVIEQQVNSKATVDKLNEIVMVLPEANFKSAEDKKEALSGIFDFKSLEILPIQETVERTVFESALHTFDLKVKEEITEEEITVSINKFLHENSNNKGKANLKTDKEGNRFVEIEIVLEESSPVDQKRSIEGLYKELTPENNFIYEEMSEKELKALKLREIKKQEMKKLKEQKN